MMIMKYFFQFTLKRPFPTSLCRCSSKCIPFVLLFQNSVHLLVTIAPSCTIRTSSSSFFPTITTTSGCWSTRRIGKYTITILPIASIAFSIGSHSLAIITTRTPTSSTSIAAIASTRFYKTCHCKPLTIIANAIIPLRSPRSPRSST